MKKTVEGFTNGFAIENFKKGETVYVFYSAMRKGEPSLTEGKVVEIVKEKNAQGHDRIRIVTIDIGDLLVSIMTPRYIKEKIYKKDDVEESKNEEPSKVIVGSEGVETVWIERAMGPKNPEVKKYLAMGWTFKEKVWDGQKNMYLSLLVKGS